MDVKCVCSICKVSFSRAVDLERHHKTKHGDTVHTCPKCGKSFNRKDSLQRHRRTCQALRFKCPRCHGLKENIQDLTAHMKLCPVPFLQKMSPGVCRVRPTQAAPENSHQEKESTRTFDTCKTKEERRILL